MINQFYFQWWLRLGLLLSLTCTTNLKALAQVTADQTLGTQVTDIGLFSVIQGGTKVGNTNLFHSFGSFNIANGGEAIFLNDPNLTNIFARVTGGTPSDIQGRISTQGTTNLFLMNPNGIIFGKNASLNIGGSFVATTANTIQFPDGAEFSLTSPVTSGNTLLSVNPTAFLFNQIANQGANSIENRGDLIVGNNKSIILLGGNVAPTPESTGQILMDEGLVASIGGRVEIGGLTAPGNVGLNVDGNDLRLSFPDSIPRTDVSIVNGGGIFVADTNSGGVAVYAKNLNLQNSSGVFLSTLRNQGNLKSKAGDILIDAQGTISLDNQSSIGNFNNFGDSGDINIKSQTLRLNNNSTVSSSTNIGNAGTVNLNINGNITLTNTSLISILSQTGNTGNIDITAQSLILLGGGIISVVPNGNAGAIMIKVKDVISLSGKFLNDNGNAIFSNGGGIDIQAKNISLSDKAIISSTNSLSGKVGDIKIKASDLLILSNRANISASNFVQENAGNISINANRLILRDSFTGIDAATLGTGNGGNINIVVKELRLENYSSISTGAFPLINLNTPVVGNAGNIVIEAEKVFLQNGGRISALSTTTELATVGRGGNITLTADVVQIDGTEIIEINGVRGTIASGINTSSIGNDAGNITINTKFLQLTNGGAISASTLGTGNAGGIIINSSDSIVINDGRIDSIVGAGGVGNGGDIQIQTLKLTITNSGQISVDIRTGGQGKGGNIHIDAVDSITISGTNSSLNADADIGSIGQPGNIIVNTDSFLLEKGGGVITGTFNSSNGGNITMNTRIFEVLSGGIISSNTGNSGKAGDIIINSTDSITISGLNSENGGVSGIAAGTFEDSNGNGGTIFLSTTNFNLSNEAGVSTRSRGRGIAGNINITARGSFNANNGLLNARAEEAGGGNINVNARNINLRNNSDIRTDLSSGNGRGGNIFLTADTIIALEDSDILAFAPEGQGGDIKFNTRAVFSDSLFNPKETLVDRNRLQSLITNSRSDINATGIISGNIIGVPDITSIQNRLTDLQGNFIETNTLIANSCIAGSPKTEGTFVITGTGGLPTRPGEAVASNYPTGDVQNVTNNSTSSSWKKGDPIVEPAGVYRLANGDLVMSSKCS